MALPDILRPNNIKFPITVYPELHASVAVKLVSDLLEMKRQEI